MTKKNALISYIFLLFVLIGSMIVIMPKHLTLSLGKDRICERAGTLRGACAALPLPEHADIVMTRPEFRFSLGGATFYRDLEMKQGLDIKGGTRVTLATDMSAIATSDRPVALQSAQDVISRRINLYGVSETSVQTARSGDEYRLIVEIPGVQNSEEAIQLIGSTAQLDFREYKPATPSAASATPSGMLVKDFVPVGLTGKDLARSNVEFDPNTGKPTIGLEFTSEGARVFAEVTARNIGKPLAIFLDEYPITSPTVSNQIVDGKAQISGDFTVAEAKQLSIALNAGALPVPIEVIGQTSVGATLGNQSVDRAVIAGLIGVGVLMVFMVLLYGFKGLLSCVSLLFYGIVTLALYKLIPVTLSLAGIAGFLLSMGMAVDTNILVFERLKEEERKDALRSATVKLNHAFSRTWNSIKDANVTTLITCFVLYNPFEWVFLNRSGIVRGFAFTLALGIFMNLFCGMFVTRVLLSLFYSSPTRRERT